MGGEYQSVVWQVGETLQRAVHLFRRAFEQSATAAGKQRVAAEQQRRDARRKEGDMVKGVARHFHYLEATTHDPAGVAFADTLVDPLDTGIVRADDPRRVAAYQFGQTTDMILVMVSNQDAAQGEILAFQHLDHRVRVTRVHDADLGVRILTE